MAVYTVHIPPGAGGPAVAFGERVEFVADKFSWPALFFGLFWVIWHRMWWVLVGYVIVLALAPAAAEFTNIAGLAQALIWIAAWLLFASEAASLRRWSLRLKGYRFAAIVSGHDQEDCERKFFDEWVSPAPVPSAPSATPPAATGPGPAPNRSDSDVIGVFPTPGARQ